MEVKERILEKAQELYLKLGFRRVTMDDIATELGMSKKTIYQHFADKNALVEECSSYFLNKEKCREQEVAEQANDPIEEIIMSTKMMREMLGTINPVAFHDLQKYYPKAWAQYLQHKSHFLEVVKNNLLKGIEKGLYRADLDIEILSRLRIESVDMAFNPDIFPEKKYRLLDIQLAFIDHFIRGIVTEKGLKAYEAIK